MLLRRDDRSDVLAQPRPRLTVERLERLEDARDVWDGLAAAAGHPFGTWEWVSSWWETFGSGKELYSFLCREPDGSPVAILPFYVAATRPVRVARFLGYGDLHAPLCAPGDRDRVVAAINQVISPRAHCRVLVAEKLPGGQDWQRLLGENPVTVHPDPVLRREGRGWEEYLSTRSRNFRKEIRRKERRLAESHDLVVRRCDDRACLSDDLRTLFDLHELRWGGMSTGVFEGSRRETQEEVAHRMLDRGWLRLWIAEVDGEPAAAEYGFNYAGSHWFYQSGRDPRFDHLSVGTVLMTHALREAFAEGVDEIRFLAGDEPYKFRFTDECYTAETHVVGSGLSATAGRAAVSMLYAMPGRMRTRVMRAGGLLGAALGTALGEVGAVPSIMGTAEELIIGYRVAQADA